MRQLQQPINDNSTLAAIAGAPQPQQPVTMKDMADALQWALEVITIAENNCPNIDWSVGHFGRKAEAQKRLEQARTAQ